MFCFFLNRTKQMEKTAAYGCACQERACVEKYRSKQLVVYEDRLAFLRLFLSFSHSLFVFLSRSVSPSPSSLPPSLPHPRCLASLSPPACLLLTNTQLISVWRFVILPAHWSLLLKTERTCDAHVAARQPVYVFWITGVFIQQLCVWGCGWG